MGSGHWLWPSKQLNYRHNCQYPTPFWPCFYNFWVEILYSLVNCLERTDFCYSEYPEYLHICWEFGMSKWIHKCPNVSIQSKQHEEEWLDSSRLWIMGSLSFPGAVWRRNTHLDELLGHFLTPSLESTRRRKPPFLCVYSSQWLSFGLSCVLLMGQV